MGNQQTRESRLPGSSESPGGAASGNPSQGRTNRHTTSANPPRPDRRNRLSRVDVFGAFTHNPAAGASSSSHARDHQPLGAVEESPAAEEPFQRKETRQEREARRREKHAALRLAERERSLHTESVDGGFLVTLGTYTGPEDFGKSVVRQLQVSVAVHWWTGLCRASAGPLLTISDRTQTCALLEGAREPRDGMDRLSTGRGSARPPHPGRIRAAP
jgi:hypothetical protein